MKKTILRPELQTFAEEMERVLSRHDDERGERGWMSGTCSVGELLRRLKEEVGELERAFQDCCPEMAIHECADVANFAMMIFSRIIDRYPDE